MRLLLSAAFLLVLNIWIAWRLFFIEWLDHFNSIEGAFIAMGKYVSQHPLGPGWLPYWHLGMPFEIVYVPGLHFVTGWTAWLGHVSPAHAYHFVTACFYVLGPVTLFFLMKRLGAGIGASLLASVIYSVFSVSTLLMPAVWRDMMGLLASRRLQVLVVYGEGPHISALTFVPLVILLLQSRRLILAAIATALVLVTNVPATMGLALLVFCWIACQEEKWKALKFAAMTGGLAYLLAMGAVPPSKYLRVLDTVGAMHPGFGASSPVRFLLLAACLATGFGVSWALRRASLPLRFFATSFSLLALIVLSANPNLFELLPQAQRLHVEMDMAFAALVALVVFRTLEGRSVLVQRAILIFVILLVGRQTYKARQKARTELREANLTAQSEYQTARWLAEQEPWTRVFAPGSNAFWLNAFTDVPQVNGCCDESWSSAAAVLKPVIFRLSVAPTDEEARNAVAWLRAFGVGALVATGPGSTEYYGDLHHPERFRFLPVIHSGFGDVVYRIPVAGSLFHVVRKDQLVMSRVPSDLVITPEVQQYMDATSGQNEAGVRQLGPGSFRLSAAVREGDVIATKIAYFDGWQVPNARVYPDKLGLMVIEPQCRGECSMSLDYVGPSSTRAARGVSVVAWGMLLVACIWKRARMVGTIERPS